MNRLSESIGQPVELAQPSDDLPFAGHVLSLRDDHCSVFAVADVTAERSIFPAITRPPFAFPAPSSGSFLNTSETRLPFTTVGVGTHLFSIANSAWRKGRSLDFAMQFIQGFYGFNALIVVGSCLAFCAQRFLWRRRERLGKRNFGFFPSYTSAGNALQALQAITQQRAEYVLAEKFDDEAEDDNQGEPSDPTRHLHRQLRRIRRGEKIKRLTVLWPH
jgi:hypothetical protein